MALTVIAFDLRQHSESIAIWQPNEKAGFPRPLMSGFRCLGVRDPLHARTHAVHACQSVACSTTAALLEAMLHHTASLSRVSWTTGTSAGRGRNRPLASRCRGMAFSSTEGATWSIVATAGRAMAMPIICPPGMLK